MNDKKKQELQDMGLIETIKNMTIIDWVFVVIIVTAMVVCIGTLIGLW